MLLNIKPESVLFFSTIGKKDLALVRKLRISVRDEYGADMFGGMDRGIRFVTFNVTLAPQGIEVECVQGQGAEYRLNPRRVYQRVRTPYDLRAKMMVKKVKEVLQGLVSAEKGTLQKLDWDDMRALRRAVEVGWDPANHGT